MALYQKYRSKTFSDLIGEDHVKKTLLEGVKSNKLTHAYLLTGPRGTGKTSTARLLAKAINCQTILDKRKKGEEISGEPCNECDSCKEIARGASVDVIEIDAASHTKVDEIREVIENAKFMPTKSAKKVYIIDEVHMLSNSSFNALLKTLEEPPSHVVFILATTEAHKLPATILSRTQRYDFHRVSMDDIVANLKMIAKAEAIDIDAGALELFAVNAEGSHRDAIGLLEQVASASGKKITLVIAQNILGIAEMKEAFGIIGAIFDNNPEEGLKIAHLLFERGTNMQVFVKETIEVLRRIMLRTMSDQLLFEDTEESKKIIEELSKKPVAKNIIKIMEIFIKAEQMQKNVSFPLLPVEMAIVESCALNQNNELRIMNQELGKVTVPKVSKLQGQPDNIDEVDEQTPAEPVASKEVTTEKKDQSHNSSSIIQDSDETVPVKVYEMTEDLWQKVIEITKKENNSLAALLRDAKPIEIQGDKMILGVRFPFHKDKISEEGNRTFLENTFSALMGKKCILSCEISDLQIKPKEKLKDDDLLAAAKEVFEIE